MSNAPTAIGHLQDDPKQLASTVRLRVLAQRCPILVYTDEQANVYAVRADSTAARTLPDDPQYLVGLYSRGSDMELIADDLAETRQFRDDHQEAA